MVQMLPMIFGLYRHFSVPETEGVQSRLNRQTVVKGGLWNGEERSQLHQLIQPGLEAETGRGQRKRPELQYRPRKKHHPESYLYRFDERRVEFNVLQKEAIWQAELNLSYRNRSVRSLSHGRQELLLVKTYPEIDPCRQKDVDKPRNKENEQQGLTEG